jgi:uncharacterized protein
LHPSLCVAEDARQAADGLLSGFYADTALCGGRIGTVCGLEFYGADHVLFASDAPFGSEGGASDIRETAKVIASLDIPPPDKEKICYRNAQTLFKLS